jgi:predicted transcriptional regulator
LSDEQANTTYRLTPEQLEEVRLAIAEADRGEFVSDQEMADFWKKCGL